MPHIYNIDELAFQKRGAPVAAFDWLSSPRLGPLSGLKWTHIDVRRLEPGRFSFPYHAHRASEEFFLILSGAATLRTKDGFRSLRQGDLAVFEAGPDSAHQLYNHSDADCVYLDVRATPGLDVVDYPDTGKINIMPQMEVYAPGGRTEYYSGEEDVARHWPADILRRPQE